MRLVRLVLLEVGQGPQMLAWGVLATGLVATQGSRLIHGVEADRDLGKVGRPLERRYGERGRKSGKVMLRRVGRVALPVA